MTRVAVGGAGFAGLAAPDALVRNGVEATVFEARDCRRIVGGNDAIARGLSTPVLSIAAPHTGPVRVRTIRPRRNSMRSS
jgi:cation diffusion facilitator CzcD-associated flavoprotein CzcO